MKRRGLLVGAILTLMLSLSACTWEDVKEKFVGSGEEMGAATGSAVASTGGAVEIEEYDPVALATLVEYKGVEVDCSVSDDEIQSEIDTLIADNVTYKKIKKGKCSEGDTVSIDYVGKLKGEPFDNGTAEDQVITLGSSGYIDGFDDGVVGMKVGQTKDVKLKFPENYGVDELNGQNVVFTITLNYIQGKEITPKFNDAFVKKNTDYKTVAEYKEGTRKTLADEKKEDAGSSVMVEVVSGSSVSAIPETLKTAYTRYLDANYQSMAASYGVDFTTFLSQFGMDQSSYETMLAEEAANSAKIHIIMEAIAAKEGLSVTDEEVRAKITEYASSGGMDEAAYREQYTSYCGEAISLDTYIKINLLQEKVVNMCKENAVIKE